MAFVYYTRSIQPSHNRLVRHQNAIVPTLTEHWHRIDQIALHDLGCHRHVLHLRPLHPKHTLGNQMNGL